MWSDIQNPVGMGAGGKRKLMMGAGGGIGPKAGRWEESSLARLQAVAVPGESGEECLCWRTARPWPYAHETIRCAENGKSYLELGSPRRRCCARQCRKERRLKVMNLCVLKLSRFRQSADPSLRRSVLVCNTLRRMEREAERDAAEEAARSPPAAAAPSPAAPQWPPCVPPSMGGGRATPFPQPPPQDTDSGYGDDECARPIDWGSVLSLSSDPLNNNEPCATAWPDEPDLDGFVHILVGSS